MCGIIGAWLPKNNLVEKQFISIIDSIHHRGPDENGLLIENNFHLGMKRLSIIDLENGQQPVFNEDQSKAVFFNGEIYNYKSLIKDLEKAGHQFKSVCDTEVIVHALEDGIHNINKLRGMFAFCFYDRKEQTIRLFRDRIGVKPLYYIYIPNKVFAFASEIKGIEKICKTIGHHLEVNEEAIFHYLSFANIPQPLTIYKGVMALMPGHELLFDTKRIEIRQYWSYQYTPKSKLSFVESKELIQKEIRESVRLRLNSDVPTGLFLSGGLDSSAIAYETAKELNTDLKTFTVGFPGNKDFDESPIAQRTAQFLGLRNEVLPLEYSPQDTLLQLNSIYDQPFADPSAIPSLGISKLASEHVKVVLNGDGGDEQFGGYRRYVLANNLKKIPNISFLNSSFKALSPARRSYLGFIQRLVKTSGLNQEDQSIALSSDMFLDRDKVEFLSLADNYSTKELIKIYRLEEGSDYLDQVMHYDRNFNLLSGLLVKMDIASSAASIEARSPFLDNILFEKSSLLDSSFKVNGTITKHILKELYKDKLPHEVVFGKKKGFEIPLNQWLKTDFDTVTQEMLSDRSSSFYNYLDYDSIQKVFCTDYFKAFNLDYLRYSLLVLYLWFNQKND